MSVRSGTHFRARERPLSQGGSGLNARLSFHSVGFVAASGDFVIIVATALLSAIVYHHLFLNVGIAVERYAAIGGICFLNFVVIGAARKSYRMDALLRFRRQLRDVALTWALVAMLSLSLIFAAKVAGGVSRVAITLFFIAGLLALIGWRAALGQWMAQAIDSGILSMRQVILIADRAELVGSNVAAALKRAGYSPALTFTFDKAPSFADLDALIEEAIRQSKHRSLDSIMLMMNWRDVLLIEHVTQALRILPVTVYVLPDERTARFVGLSGSAIAGLAAAEVQRAPLSRTERAAKRLFDIALASVGLVLLLPLMVVVALLVKLEFQGQILFQQTRVGFNGRPFRIFKFRSMLVSEDGSDVRQATRNDPRVTRLGRWLRRTNIDELPQLWNVLKGDMSIVGPRPHAVAHDLQYQTLIGNYAFRHHVRPGLTGWAQVNGLRGETKTLDLMERRVEHDLYYIDHWSPLLDLLIVLLTIKLMIRDPSAF